MRASEKENAHRLANMVARVTITKTSDDALMQTADVEVLKGEKKTEYERFQNYGHTSVPLPETGKDSHEAAEAIVVYVGGNRSHAAIVGLDDRRHRPNNLKPGESALYDEQGNQVYVSRDVLSITGMKEIHLQVGSAHVVLTSSKVRAQFGDVSVTMKGGKLYLGKEDCTHKVMTEDGASERVFAVLDEAEENMAAAPKASRTKKGK
jgi:phage baseplate assembly protein V